MPPRPARWWPRLLGLALVGVIVLPAVFGSPDAALNPSPRLLFTVGWAALLVLSLLVGPVWQALNPLRLLTAGLARASGDPGEHTVRPLPAAVGLWPAVVAAVALSVAQHALQPTTVLVLLWIMGYGLVQLAAAAVYGSRWYAVGDVFEVASGQLGLLAPLACSGEGTLRWLSPRRSLLASAEATGMSDGEGGRHAGLASLVALAGVLLGADLFDAATTGGTSADRLPLLAGWTAATAAALWLTVRPLELAPALLPLLAGSLSAHYLGPLLVDTQVVMVQLSDPLDRGWDLLGSSGADVGATPLPPALGVSLQAGLLLAGHLLAAVVAHDLAEQRVSSRVLPAVLFPLRAAIVTSLLLGLWLRFGGW